MPATMVAKTKGAMIILISRRKMSVTTVKLRGHRLRLVRAAGELVAGEADGDPEDDAEPDP